MSTTTNNEENNKEERSHFDIYKEYGQKLPLDVKLLRLWDDAEFQTQQKVSKLVSMGVSDTVEVALTLYMFHKMWTKIGLASLNKAIELKKLKPEDIKTADECVLEMYRYFMELSHDESKIDNIVRKSNMPEELKKMILNRHDNPNVQVDLKTLDITDLLGKDEIMNILDKPTEELAYKVMDKMFKDNPDYEEFKKRSRNK